MLLRLCGVQARRLSTASSPYDNYTKLREEAQKLLSPTATLYALNRHSSPYHYAAVLLTILFPSLNLIDFLRPSRFSAVYFPAWIVTGEVEARITYKDVQAKISALFDRTYIPGSHGTILSAAPLKTSSLMKANSVPFTKSLLHQHGETVQCIPFSISPFSALDFAASQSPSRSITINKHLSIDPSSVKPNLMFACPILIPLYLAQYEINNGTNNNMFTFILRAYEPLKEENLMSENLSKIDKKTRQAIETRDKLTFNDHDSSGEVYSGYPQCPRVSMPMISIPNQTIEKSINEWLAELLCSSENINILAENSLGVLGKGDDDLRMREMTEEEKSSMETYVLLNSAILSAKNVLYRMKDLEAMEPSPENNQLKLLSKEDLLKEKKCKEKEVEMFEDALARCQPKWWTEWLALNRPESGGGVKNNAAAGETTSPPPPKNLDKVD